MNDPSAHSEIELEEVPCDLCGSRDFDALFTGVDWEFGRMRDPRVVQCRTCNLVQLNPRPTAASAHLIYPPAYRYYEDPRRSWKRRVQRVVSRILKRDRRYPYLDGVKPGTILDVGCAAGISVYPYGQSGSLLTLRKMGWQVAGCDIDSASAEAGSRAGLNIRVGKITDIDFGDARFDVVRFNHSMEHSTSPRRDLSAAFRLLRPGGIVIVSVPNIQSANYSLFGRYWSGLDLPRHFYQFTPATLRKYLDAAGFAVKEEHFDAIPSDFTHSLKHFLHGDMLWGRPKACMTEDVIRDRFSRRQFAQLLNGLRPVVRLFNEKGLGDSITLVAAKSTEGKGSDA